MALLAMAWPGGASGQTIEWIRQFGTAANDAALSIAADAAAVYVAGEVSSSQALPGQTSAGGVDAFVRRYDVNGAIVWTRQFGTTVGDRGRGVAVDASGVYVVGVTNGALPTQSNAGIQDAFIRKYDLNGTEQWTRQFGSANSDSALAVAANAGGVYVAGTTFGALPGQTTSGQEDAFVRKYDANGTEVWTRQFGSAGSEADTAVVLDSSAVYVAGTTDGALPGQTDGALTDAYVRKYDTNGTVVWTRQFGSTGAFASDGGTGVAVDSSGVYVAGLTQGTLPGQTLTGSEDAFIRKYDANGTEVWTRQFGPDAAGFSGASGVGVNAAGVHVMGDVTGALPGQTSAGQDDFYLRSYDSNGTLRTTLQSGSASSEFVYGAAASSNGIYLAGEALAVLPGQSSAGQDDAFAVKFTPPDVVCTYSIAPTSQAFPAAGGNGSVTVNTQTGCAWAATSNSAFVNITSGANGSGAGTVNFTVAAHVDASSRSGTLTVAGQTFTVNQAAANCTYSLNPTSQNFTAAGGNGVITVTAPGSCPWTATSNAAFISITSSSASGGNGTVNYTVASNSTTSGRVGTVTIADQTLTVNQDAGTPPPPNAPAVFDGGVVNNGSFAPSPAAVAPGSIAAVFGNNLNDGSTVLSSSFGQDGKLVTTLGGASVRINNIPAPLFYSTPGQLGVQIPFELAGQTSATIVVTAGGQSSAPRTLNLDTTAPGIFTVNQQGTGIAAVLHQDGITPVSAANPAHPNEVVVFFLTGLGAVNPALATGAPSAGNPTALTPTVTVDGVNATLDFSGAAPNFVGLYQINLRIPANTRTAADIPVRVTIGGKASNQVTIPVAP